MSWIHLNKFKNMNLDSSRYHNIQKEQSAASSSPLCQERTTQPERAKWLLCHSPLVTATSKRLCSVCVCVLKINRLTHICVTSENNE